MSNEQRENRRPWQRVIGIAGGMGPYAHIEFERRLLAAIELPGSDQDYPEWIVSSVPATPDRTLALLGEGPSPMPCLLRSFGHLAARADFAVLTCITAHAFLDEIRAQVRLPILDIVVPLALGRDPVESIPLLDPLDLAAGVAVRIARGELPLPTSERRIS